MLRKFVGAVFLAAVTGGFAAAQVDCEKLQGTWTITSSADGGQKLPGEVGGGS